MKVLAWRTENSPKWKIDAASTASACPAVMPSARCCNLPTPPDAITGMFEFLTIHRRQVPSASFVFVLSDFIRPTPLETWEWALDRGWDVVPVIFQDPVWEQRFPNVDRIVVPLVGQNGRTRLVRLAAGESQKLPNGIVSAVVKTGTGTQKAKPWDTVTFNYSAWDKDGRMFDSTELRKRPATVPPYRQSMAMETMLTSMLPGSRVRFWVPSEQMQAGKPIAGMPEGLLVYEIELLTIVKGKQPPPVPPDVAAPLAAVRARRDGAGWWGALLSRLRPRRSAAAIVRPRCPGRSARAALSAARRYGAHISPLRLGHRIVRSGFSVR